MKQFLILGILVLSGCSSITFDGGQFDRYITLTETSRAAIKFCGQPQIIDKVGLLVTQISHINLYASYRKASPEVMVASQKLNLMIDELNNSFGNALPSKTYCEEKIKNIADGANTISATLGAQ